jgi:polygalacturonase
LTKAIFNYTNIGADIGDKVIAIKVGRNLLFENIIHENGGHFVYLLNDCENVIVEKVTIKKSRDAIDLMGCRNVSISDVHFTGCSDDTIGVKSDYALGRKIDSENIYVWNGYFESGCNGLQFGSETVGDFKNVNFWNIEIGKAQKAGIGITTCDGSVINGVNYKNIIVKGAATPIYFLVWDRLRSGESNKKVGAIKNIKLTDITISHQGPNRDGNMFTSAITGHKDSHIENVIFENLKLIVIGNGTKDDASIKPPETLMDFSPRNMGKTPATYFYVRHAKGITFKNVEFRFENHDKRPGIVATDVDGLTFDNVKAAKTGSEALRLDKIQELSLTKYEGLEDRKVDSISSETKISA